MNSFLQQLDHKTEWLQKGEQVLLFEFSSRSLFPHDDESYFEAWEIFALALQHDNNARGNDKHNDNEKGGGDSSRGVIHDSQSRQDAERWTFEKIPLPSRVLECLRPVLPLRNISSLKLEMNHFYGAEGILFLSEFLKENMSLVSLEVQNNPLDGGASVEMMSRFCHAMEAHPSLTRICLAKMNLGADLDILRMILNACRNMNYLDLSRNRIDTQNDGEATSTSSVSAMISEYLGKNPPLKCLSLEQNRLCDNFALQLARALRKNFNLKRLFLRSNNIGEEGKMAVRNAQYNLSSLDAIIDESNHTCQIIFHVIPAKDPFRNLYGSTSSEIHKTVKINSYLMATKNLVSGKNGIMEDLPLEVMPHALKRLQNARHWREIHDSAMGYAHHCLRIEISGANGNQNEADADYSQFLSSRSPLTLTYEVVRTWKLQLLFNNHRYCIQCHSVLETICETSKVSSNNIS
mmetsp:Transcript_2763/g.5813  ORF Transcript_2763/g.5813 Transcript_2763/m.5813 type:complete len:463 (-) Transcript_2763:1837-3225(-)